MAGADAARQEFSPAMLHLLVILDHQEDRAALRRALAQRFPELITTEPAGAEELERAMGAGPFDAAITGAQLAWGDGLLALKRIREGGHQCPVLMWGERDHSAVAVEALHAGLDAYVPRGPGDERRLAAALSAALGESPAGGGASPAEQEARRAADEARRRLAAMVEASAILSGSLDYGTTLQQVANLMVPALGDWCAVDVLDEQGVLQRLAVAHTNPARAPLAYELHRRYPSRRDAPGGVWQSMLTGEPQLHSQLSTEMLAVIAQDDEHLRLLEALVMRSVMFVPLIARGRAIGALNVVSSDERRRYDETDVQWATVLARRAALAIDNARLYGVVVEQREWFRTTLASIGDAVIVTDVASRVRFMNGVAEGLTAWPAAEAEGRPLGEVFHAVHEATRLSIESPVEQALRSGAVVSLADNTLLLARDGRAIPVDDSAAPIYDEAGVLSGVVLVFRDITARRRAEQELRASRDQLAIILRGITDGITVQDRSGALIYANDTAAQISGFASAEELIATPRSIIMDRYELFDEEGDPFPLERLPGRLALQGHTCAEQIVRFRSRASGLERWSAVSATPVFDQQGAVTMAVNIFRDITVQKRAEQAERFLNAAGVALATSLDTDTTLRIVAELVVPTLADWCAVNLLQPDGSLAAVTISHADPARLPLGWELANRYPLDLGSAHGTGKAVRTGRSELIAEITDAILAEMTRDAEHARLMRAVGFRSMLCAPLLVGSRALGAILFVGERPGRFDAQDQMLAEELAQRVALALENARLYGEAQAAIAARDQFLSIASHELKTPLTALTGYIGILRRRLGPNPALSASDQRALQVIETQGRRLHHLILSLLDLSRLESGQLSIEPAPLDLGALTRQVIEELEPTLDHHRVELELPAAPLMIMGDALRLEQVIHNLLQNAVKYSPAGGPVKARVALRGQMACLSVEDQGIGIPVAALPRLFGRFYRAPNAEAKRIGGMGVGLYVVREIMELHGGRVEVTSVEGEGSSFTLCFPHGPAIGPPA
jgi:PAS domain S-box-containing protein